jgi:predicted transcriptional regulator
MPFTFPLTFQEITDKCETNRNRCRKTLNQLAEKGLINESPHKKGQKAFFSLTEKGRSEALKEVGNALAINYRILKFDLENTFKATTLNHIRHDAAFHPTQKEFETNHIPEERVKEMEMHREQVLEPMNTIFFELARDFTKADGRIGAQENLENIAFWFEEGKAHFIVLRDKKSVGKFLRDIREPGT